jgi:hypothetical protein
MRPLTKVETRWRYTGKFLYYLFLIVFFNLGIYLTMKDSILWSLGATCVILTVFVVLLEGALFLEEQKHGGMDKK